MPSNYQKILQDNIREYGEGVRHLAFLERLYSDRTHFVLELLQNAEDARATQILFEVHPDRLEVLHDGRLFDERDVRGICGVGDGTKVEDLTQIGKFGIGFKSVYAYTSTPEIHSGSEHFRVVNYVRPFRAEPRATPRPWTTRFVFPFDHPKVKKEQASAEILRRLRNLNARTLLFLRSIGRLRWSGPEGESGEYSRHFEHVGQIVRIAILKDSNDVNFREKWLACQRAVALPGGRDPVAVEAAFLLREAKESDKPAVVRIGDSPLVVFFPTEKLTKLGFLVQGPYRTTPARDNIPTEDAWNQMLVQETAQLVSSVLGPMKKQGLLTPGCLEALPIDVESFPPGTMFRPIFDAVKETLIKEPLLPTEEADGVAAGNAVMARGSALRDILNENQLRQLLSTDRPLKWLLSEITHDRTPALQAYLTDELGVVELTPDNVARRMSREFFEMQSDDWFRVFYGFLNGQEALWREARYNRPEGPLRNLPLIRLEDGRHEPPFQRDGTPNVYLPLADDTDLPVVKRYITEDKEAMEFLRRLGLYVPDIVDEVINNVLPKYSQDGPITQHEHDNDISKLLMALHTDSTSKRERVIQAARQTACLMGMNAVTGERDLVLPIQLYLRSDDLEIYFARSPNTWFLDEALDRLASADCEALGIETLPRRIAFEPDFSWQEKETLRCYCGSSRNETLTDFFLDGLEDFLGVVERVSDVETRKAIGFNLWDILVRLVRKNGGKEFFEGKYEWFFYYSRQASFDAAFVKQLREASWLPTHDGEVRRPAGMNLEELPDEFERDEILIRALKLRDVSEEAAREAEVRAGHAMALGVDIEDIMLLKEHSDQFRQWKEAIRSLEQARPVFPERPSRAPERRETKLAESIEASEHKDYGERSRSVRVSKPCIDPSIWLRSQYTNEDGQMICQICEQEMPFRKRNGEHYFEAVEGVNGEKEFEGCFLALCPLCAAKFKEFVKRDSGAMVEFEELVRGAEEFTVPIRLGDEEASVRFVETHLCDLRTYLKSVS